MGRDAVSPPAGTLVVNVGDDIRQMPDAVAEEEYAPRCRQCRPASRQRVDRQHQGRRRRPGARAGRRHAHQNQECGLRRPDLHHRRGRDPARRPARRAGGSGVEVAFGPDGSIIVGPGTATDSSGNNFTQPPGNIGDGFGLIAAAAADGAAVPGLQGPRAASGSGAEEDQNESPVFGDFTAGCPKRASRAAIGTTRVPTTSRTRPAFRAPSRVPIPTAIP